MSDKFPLKYMRCSFDGSKSYIYLWISKKCGIVYVGQTNGKDGTLGRAINHVQYDGTLRRRFREIMGLELEYADDLYLLSFPLPKGKEFISIESSYRLAVEYKVQTKLLESRGQVNPCFRVISQVTYTDVASNKQIISLADNIVDQFIEIYTSKQVIY